MKQHITVEQFDELSDESKEKLREWWKPEDQDLATYDYGLGKRSGVIAGIDSSNGGDWIADDFDKKNKFYILGNDWDYELCGTQYKAYPLLSTGQMIEFLGTNFFELGRFSEDLKGSEYQVTLMDMKKQYVQRELCDALWQAVKEVLEKKD